MEGPAGCPVVTGKIVSLCSGVRGLDLSFGDQVAYHAEIDPDACRVLEARSPGVPNLGSLKTVWTEPERWTSLGEMDGVIGGPPCQPFTPPASGSGPMIPAGSGPKRSRLYGWWDPDGSCWKTPQDSFPGLERSSQPFPRSGLISRGTCFELHVGMPAPAGSILHPRSC